VNLPPKKRLGRGLDGLLAPVPAPQHAPSGGLRPSRASVADLHPNKDQPRKHFDDEALDELAQSIRELGVLEPILVRKLATGGYEIIAGERRWRAAQRAGVLEVPIHLTDFSHDQAYVASLVENLQREDLRPLEIAKGYQYLVEHFGLTQELVAEKVGKSRVSVANSLRLLKLPEVVLELLDVGTLSEGHGRALLQASSPKTIEKLAREAAAKGWSVRETEKRARDAGSAGSGKGGESPEAPTGKSSNVAHLEKRISMSLNMATSIEESGPGKGRLVISYANLDDLDRVIAKLLG